MKRLLLALPLLLSTSLTTLATEFIFYELSDAPQIVDANRNNEPRFNRDYKGKGLKGIMTFRMVFEASASV
jgi:hypothetical protein